MACWWRIASRNGSRTATTLTYGAKEGHHELSSQRELGGAERRERCEDPSLQGRLRRVVVRRVDAPQGRPAGPVGGGSVAPHRIESGQKGGSGEATQLSARYRYRHDAALLERQAGRRRGRVSQVRRGFPRPRRARGDSLGL